jgi:predicted nucleic acid-binding protein
LIFWKVMWRAISVPTGVVAEVHAKAGKFPQAAALAVSGQLTVLPSGKSFLLTHLQQSLHQGEAECLALALEQAHRKPLLILDDAAARTAAAMHGIAFIGTLGILLTAKQSGRIGRIEPLMIALRDKARFWISENLWNTVLHKAGEFQSPNEL